MKQQNNTTAAMSLITVFIILFSASYIVMEAKAHAILDESHIDASKPKHAPESTTTESHITKIYPPGDLREPDLSDLMLFIAAPPNSAEQGETPKNVKEEIVTYNNLFKVLAEWKLAQDKNRYVPKNNEQKKNKETKANSLAVESEKA